jgi:prevent-host-death family protein
MAMSAVELSELKSRCLELVDEVARTGEPVVITRDGKPVARLEAAERKVRGEPALHPKRLFGLHKESTTILGDIVAPIDVEWEAER